MYKVISLNDFLNSTIASFNDVLDLGCGAKGTHDFLCKSRVRVDAWSKFDPDYILNLETTQLPFKPNSFDVILLLDVIEHLEKENSYNVLEQSKAITKDKIIILTPLWWTTNEKNVLDPKSPYYENTFNYHKSKWVREDLPEFTHFLFGDTPEEYILAIWYKNKE